MHQLFGTYPEPFRLLELGFSESMPRSDLEAADRLLQCERRTTLAACPTIDTLGHTPVNLGV